MHRVYEVPSDFKLPCALPGGFGMLAGGLILAIMILPTISSVSREVLRAVCPEFREMPPDTIREKTFCCGAGGGLLADEIMDLRMKGAKPRAEACKSTGANHMATICAICKAQLPLVMNHYEMEVAISGVMDLLGKALVL